MIILCGAVYGIIFDQLGGDPLFTYWNVEGQPVGNPVVLQQGSTTEMYIEAYVLLNDIFSLNVDADIMMADGSYYDTEIHGDASAYLENTLPVMIGESLRVRFQLPVNDDIPKGMGTLMVRFTNETGYIVAGGKSSIEVY